MDEPLAMEKIMALTLEEQAALKRKEMKKTAAKRRLRGRGPAEDPNVFDDFEETSQGAEPSEQSKQVASALGTGLAQTKQPSRSTSEDSAASTGEVMGKTAGAAAMGFAAGGPVGAGVAGGAALVGGLMSQRAQRERDKIRNEMNRRKNMADAIQRGAAGQSSALQNIVDNLAKALL